MLLITGKSGSIGQHILGHDAGIRLSMSIGVMKEKISSQIKKTSLLHLAATTNIGNIALNEKESFELNVLGSVRLMEAFITSGGQNFFFASSGHVYGPQKTTQGCKEVDPTNPISVYAKQKLETEDRLMAVAERQGISITIFRIFSVFGPKMPPHYLAGRIENLVQQNKYENINFMDDIRDFSSPIEVATDISSIVANAQPSRVINICSGNASSVKNKILSSYPNWPMEMLIPGNSDMPILVGKRNDSLPPRNSNLNSVRESL